MGTDAMDAELLNGGVLKKKNQRGQKMCDHELLGIYVPVGDVRHFDGPTVTCKTCGQELMNSGEVDKRWKDEKSLGLATTNQRDRKQSTKLQRSSSKDEPSQE